MCSTFEFDLDLEYPDAALSITRLLLLSDAEWEKVQGKGKPPKPKADAEVLGLLAKVIENRLGQYPTSLEVSQHAGIWKLYSAHNPSRMTKNSCKVMTCGGISETP